MKHHQSLTRCTVAAALLLATMPCLAAAKSGSLFKCVNAAGVISIQSEACAPGATQVWKRDAAPKRGRPYGDDVWSDAEG